jgi:hypothetical protein
VVAQLLWRRRDADAFFLYNSWLWRRTLHAACATKAKWSMAGVLVFV